jgi:hypothetical protein
MLEKEVKIWNEWRLQNPLIKPNLHDAYLTGADLSNAIFINTNLSDANLQEANLSGANLQDTNLYDANLSGSDLSDANLNHANLSNTNLIGANLIGANLYKANLEGAHLQNAHLNYAYLNDANLERAILVGANLSNAKLNGANLIEADLSKADLSRAIIINARLNGATLTDCKIFGISAWGIEGLEEAEQSNLVITDEYEAVITVDNLEVAQFIYLLLHSEKIRSVIDTITAKVVLILGRFTPERKMILNAIREELRKHDYLPILFDFDRPASRNLTETVSTLAHIARFIIADITETKSIPQELQRIFPSLPSVPVQPILKSSAYQYGMYEDFTHYPWVLEIQNYNNLDDLLKFFRAKIIIPAEAKVKELPKK